MTLPPDPFDGKSGQDILSLSASDAAATMTQLLMCEVPSQRFQAAKFILQFVYGEKGDKDSLTVLMDDILQKDK